MKFARILLILLLAGAALAQSIVAPTPPMGWNSWNCYGATVTEAEVRANAAYMATHLKSHGWQYVVVDIEWFEPNARAHGYRTNARLTMDQYGRLIPAPNRFPSSAGENGFKPLADYIHSLGLKFGIHILRGVPRQAAIQDTPIFGSTYRAAQIANQGSICKPGSWPDADMLPLGRIGIRAASGEIAVQWAGMGLPENCTVRDLWEKKYLGSVNGGRTFRLGPHASGLYRVATAQEQSQ